MWHVIKLLFHELKTFLAITIIGKIVKDNLPDFNYKVVIKEVRASLNYIKEFFLALAMWFAIWQMKRSYDKLDTQMQGKVLLGLVILVVCIVLDASSKNKELKTE
jgi:hypothetical protein